MKTSSILAMLLAIIVATGCNKDKNAPQLSEKIQKIVPADILAKMKAQGMPINEGLSPPNVEGIFASTPHTLVSTYEGDTRQPGFVFNNLTVKFSNQDSKNLSVTIDTKAGSAIATGIGGFISGTGNKFSLFAQLDYSDGIATGKQLRVFSGEVTANGIKDFHTTVVFTEKNDPANTLLAIGNMRVIKDGDGVASREASFASLLAPTTAQRSSENDVIQ